MNCGTCGNCGGRVSVPTIWLGIHPPTPQCESCGAVPKNAHGPVIEMEPPVKYAGKDMIAEFKGQYVDGELELVAFEGKDRQFKTSIYST